MKLIPAPPHNSIERLSREGSGGQRKMRRVRLLGWDENGEEITPLKDNYDDLTTHTIIPALPGYYAVETWLNMKEDALLSAKYPVIAWRMESSSYFGAHSNDFNTTAKPICAGYDICNNEAECPPILSPDGFVYEDESDPCEFKDWLTRKFKDTLAAQEKARQLEVAQKARDKQLESLKGCTDPIVFLRAVLENEGRAMAARILSKLTPARKSARDITPEQHEPIIAACQKTLRITP